MPYHFNTNIFKTLSDTNTPVELYLKLRDKFQNAFLLESSDHTTIENSYSYLCLQPLASFVVNRETTFIKYPDGSATSLATSGNSVSSSLQNFIASFKTEETDLRFITNGIFGYTSYDAIPLFHNVAFKAGNADLPLMQYHLFRFLIVFNHFNNELYLLEHIQEGETSGMEPIKDIIAHRAVTQYPFACEDNEVSSFTDGAFLETIQKGIDHCDSGLLSGVNLSRKFTKKFTGDEFNVYRALRSVNPSGYLFYFDYGSFKIFGSSPEAQLVIKDGTAVVKPIAATMSTIRNQNDANPDTQAALTSQYDAHVAIVMRLKDALDKHSIKTTILKLMAPEHRSHATNLLSEISAVLVADYNLMEVFASVFPSGMISGIPKMAALEFIEENEPINRGFYGGAVGIIGFDQSYNHAVFNRSFVSADNQLAFQAGCFISSEASAADKLQEVNDKLVVLQTSIALAQTL